YEATAVEDTLQHPWKALITSMRGPKTTGEMVAEPTPKWVTGENKTPKKLSDIQVTLINK
ncbi:MAG TPA: hopanoid biosynthesis associated radical SAM protein HpnH, partial [Nitrosomonas sp.]|nr:hopanoid biosynthesis associated radical SAM protein HpnH [Nitrosomonas sp.]